MNKLTIFLVLLFDSIILDLWMQCHTFSERLYFSQFDIVLKINTAMSNDVGNSTLFARFFHNKASVEFSELLAKYLQFWDIHFVLLFYSIVNFFGILYGIWYVVAQKKWKERYTNFLIVLTCIPLIILFNPPITYPVQLIMLMIPLQLFSLYGMWKFMKRYKVSGWIMLILLLILSFWYSSVFQKDIFINFCYNI